MKKKVYDDDDGRTVVNMNVEGMPWYNPVKSEKKERNSEDKPRRKELFAMIRGAFSAYLPPFLITVGCLGIAFVLLYFWFNG